MRAYEITAAHTTNNNKTMTEKHTKTRTFRWVLMGNNMTQKNKPLLLPGTKYSKVEFFSSRIPADKVELLSVVIVAGQQGPVVSMNKLVIVSVLIALLTLGAESFRVPREIEEEEKKGPVTMIIDKLRNYYDYSLGVAGSYVDTIKDLNLDEKAKNLYEETTGAVRTYAGIFQDQLYHMIYSSDSA
ncbi:hypothetical protein QTP86_029415 [Hemibagrus guttatus]|nr:hypothetical protein QTP86_029415 [Hemibagrus guttatus]